MTIQEFEHLYFREQLEIFNEYQDNNCLDDHIYTNDAGTIQDLYSDNIEQLLRDLSQNNYNYNNDYFCITIYGLETFDRPKAQQIINENCSDIMFRKWLEDYNY